MDKIIFTFNQFFYDMLKDVKNTSASLKSEIKKNYKFIDRNCHDNITFFDEMFTPEMFQVVLETSEEDIFQNTSIQSFPIMQEITVKQVVESIGEDYQNTLKSYFYILVILNHISNLAASSELEAEKVYDAVITCLRKIQRGEDHVSELDDILDDDVKNVLEKLHKVFSCKVDVKEPDVSALPPFNPGMLENTTIGSLAKEIASELDVSKINIEKPEDLLNFNANNNLLGSIVGKIGSKVNEKIEKGELKHEDLLGEAMGLLKSLGGSAGNGNPLSSLLNNPMLKGMMSGGNTRANDEKVRSGSTREKLRKKLEKRTN